MLPAWQHWQPLLSHCMTGRCEQQYLGEKNLVLYTLKEIEVLLQALRMPYMWTTNNDTGTETEDSLQKRMSTEIQLDPGHLPSDVHLENERLPFCAEFIMESKNVIEKEETKLKQEPCLVEETTSEMKAELEVIHGSDILIKTEPASDLTIPSDPHIHRDHEIHTKIEIKEEPVYQEMIHKERSQPEEINREDVDLHLDTQNDTTEGHEDFRLPKSSRLDAVTTAGKDKGALKLKENNNPWYEKGNIIIIQECDITGTFHVDDTMSHLCEICGKCFSLASYLQTHQVAVHKSQFKCKKCEKSFTYLANLRAHNLIHEDEKPFKCDKCYKSFTQSSSLRAHSVIHESKRPFKCDKCDRSFIWLSHLRAHNVIHESQRPFKCDKCDKGFSQSLSLRAHSFIHESKRPFRCDKCDRSFIWLSHLRAHTLIHEGIRPFKHGKCNTHFAVAQRFRTHNLNHKGTRPFKCDNYDKSFTQLKNLERHLIHEGKEVFKCDKYDKTFPQPNHLKNHYLIHGGKRQFKCNKCDKSFIQASLLKKHNLIHRKRRSFKCDKCNRSYTTLSKLEKHNLIHE